MRSGSTLFFLLKTSLLCCVWCYCFGNNKQKGRKTNDESSKQKKNSRESRQNRRDSSSSAKLNDSSVMQGSLSSIRIDDNTVKGYVNPDFYIPFIDCSDNDTSTASTLKTLKKNDRKKSTNQETIHEVQELRQSVVVETEKPTICPSKPSEDNEQKTSKPDDEKVICEKEKENVVDRSNCSSVKSSDFVVVLETARNNVEEIAKVRNSYYEKLAEASFVPICIQDELVEERINFQLVTEELRRVGDKYLVRDIRPSISLTSIELIPDNLTILPDKPAESPDSGMDSKPSTVSPNYQQNSKSSECLKDEICDAGLLMVASKNDDLQKQIVTTTVVQTATTTLTQVQKRFSENWKELEIKTRRVVRSNSRTSNSSECPSDDLKDLHICVQSEQGEPKVLVDETSRVVSQPRDNRVTSEYLTNLSHMLIDDCRNFHGHNGVDTPSDERSVAESAGERTLSGVIASIKHTIAQVGPQRSPLYDEFETFDLNGNNDDYHRKIEFIDANSPATDRPGSTLVISLHLTPANNLLEQHSPLPPPVDKPLVQKTEKLVIIRETYQPNGNGGSTELENNHHQEQQLIRPTSIENDDDDVIEDINIRRAREAAAFAQRFFQQEYKYA